MRDMVLLAMAGLMGAMKNFSHLGHLYDTEVSGPPPPTGDFYITEDSVDFYVAEDGTTFYVQE